MTIANILNSLLRVCALVFFVSQGHAAERQLYRDAVEEPPVIEEIITAATRRPAVAQTLPASVSVLSRDVLGLINHAHIADAVERIAGVNLQRGNGQEYLPAVRSPILTGAGGCAGFQMTEDGIALRAAGFCNINELFEAHTEAAERIEVLRGAGTVLYGSNAMHGVINVITPEVGAFNTIGIDMGEYGLSRLKFSLNSKGQHSMAVQGTLTQDEGYRDTSGYGQQKITARYSYASDTIGIATGFTAVNLNQETAGYITGLDAYKDPQRARENPNPEAFRDARAVRLWSKVRIPVGVGEWMITPYARSTEMDFLQHFLPGKPQEENGQYSVGLQTSYFVPFSKSVDLTAGVDAEYTRAFLKQTQVNPTIGSAFLQATIPQGKHYDYAVDALQIAPFIHFEWLLSDQLVATGGGRYEFMSYDYVNRMLDGRSRDDGTLCGFGGCRYSRPPSAVNDYDNHSLDATLRYQADNDHTLYLRVARAFRAPQATELYRLQRGQQVTDLEPEKVRSVELGFKGRHDTLNYAATFYQMAKHNVIFRDVAFRNVSDGETEHQGVELEISYPLADSVMLSLNGTYARHKYANNPALLRDNDGNVIAIKGHDVDSAPRYFGGVRALWEVSSSTRVEVEWSSMGSYYLDPENAHRYAGHRLVNIRSSWRPRSNTTVYARVLNVANRAYAKRADFTTFTGERYFPGMPRRVTLGFDVRW